MKHADILKHQIASKSQKKTKMNNIELLHNQDKIKALANNEQLGLKVKKIDLKWWCNSIDCPF